MFKTYFLFFILLFCFNYPANKNSVSHQKKEHQVFYCRAGHVSLILCLVKFEPVKQRAASIALRDREA